MDGWTSAQLPSAQFQCRYFINLYLVHISHGHALLWNDEISMIKSLAMLAALVFWNKWYIYWLHLYGYWKYFRDIVWIKNWSLQFKSWLGKTKGDQKGYYHHHLYILGCFQVWLHKHEQQSPQTCCSGATGSFPQHAG